MNFLHSITSRRFAQYIGVSVLWLVICGFILYPILLGDRLNQSDKAFSGVVGLYADEAFYYLALGPMEMRDDQKLFGSDKFMRAEEAMFINPIGNLIALMASVSGLSEITCFSIFRTIAALILLIGFYSLANQFIDGFRWQMTGLLFFAFGAGWNGCSDVLSACSWAGSAPELNMFIAMIGEYYIPLANGLFLLYMAAFYRCLDRHFKKWWTAGLLLFVLGAVYVYGALVAILLSVVHLTFESAIGKRMTLQNGLSIGLRLTVWLSPVGLYYLWLFSKMDNAARSEGWVIGPDLVETGLSFFWLMAPAFLLLLSNLKGVAGKPYFPLFIWMATGLLFTRIPPPFLPFQVQAFIGLQAPLCILAVLFFQNVFWPSSGDMWRKGLIPLSIAVFFASTVDVNVEFYKNMLNRLEQRAYPEFIHTSDMEAMKWVSANVPASAAFAIVETKARAFAGMTGCRVLYRNTPFSEKSDERQLLTDWGRSVMDKAVTDVPSLRENGVTHLYVDQEFLALYLPSTSDVLPKVATRIHANKDVSIWRLY